MFLARVDNDQITGYHYVEILSKRFSLNKLPMTMRIRNK